MEDQIFLGLIRDILTEPKVYFSFYDTGFMSCYEILESIGEIPGYEDKDFVLLEREDNEIEFEFLSGNEEWYTANKEKVVEELEELCNFFYSSQRDYLKVEQEERGKKLAAYLEQREKERVFLKENYTPRLKRALAARRGASEQELKKIYAELTKLDNERQMFASFSFLDYPVFGRSVAVPDAIYCAYDKFIGKVRAHPKFID